MFVTRSKENREIRRAIGMAAADIKPLFPSLEAVRGAQANGGICIAKKQETSAYVSPRIYTFASNSNSKDGDEKLAMSIDKDLIPVAQLAHFGDGEETVLDTDVRKTLSISPSKCRVDWNPHLSHAVAEFGRDVLHLSDANVHHLSAELHNVLIYTEGDFFAPHRDSYKTEGHIGTMSVLVSDFDGDNNNNEIDGGTLYFAVGTELRSWDATKEQPWAGWIGSVRHAVTKVKSGRRVVAVYNLIMKIDDESDERKGVRGKSKHVMINRLSSTEKKDLTSASASPSSTLYMPGTGPISKMPLAMFHRLIEAPHLSLDDLKTLRLVCRAFDDHIGGIVGLLSKSFLVADKMASKILKTWSPFLHLQSSGCIPVVVPLRNIYSSGGEEYNIPPHHLYGQDLLMYEAIALALGRKRVKIIPASLMLERQCQNMEYTQEPETVALARDFADAKHEQPIEDLRYRQKIRKQKEKEDRRARYLNSDDDGNDDEAVLDEGLSLFNDDVSPKPTVDSNKEKPPSPSANDNNNAVITSLDNNKNNLTEEEKVKKARERLGYLSWEELRNDVDFEVRVHPIPFEPCCMFWGGERRTLAQWKKRGYSIDCHESDESDGLDKPESDPHNKIKTVASSPSSGAADKREEKKSNNALLKTIGNEIHDRSKIETYTLEKRQEAEVSGKLLYKNKDLAYEPYDDVRVDKKYGLGEWENRQFDSDDTLDTHAIDSQYDESDSDIDCYSVSEEQDEHGYRRLQQQRKKAENSWRRRHLKLRNDPLSSLIPLGYSGDLWGNNATARIYTYRVSAMVFVLGGGENANDEEKEFDWNSIIGPDPAKCCEGLMDVQLTRGKALHDADEYY